MHIIQQCTVKHTRTRCRRTSKDSGKQHSSKSHGIRTKEGGCTVESVLYNRHLPSSWNLDKKALTLRAIVLHFIFLHPVFYYGRQKIERAKGGGGYFLAGLLTGACACRSTTKVVIWGQFYRHVYVQLLGSALKSSVSFCDFRIFACKSCLQTLMQSTI